MSKTGEEGFAKVSIGQRGYAGHAIANYIQVAWKPKSIGFVESAAIPTAGLAALQSLSDIAGLEKGQSMSIHRAAVER